MKISAIIPARFHSTRFEGKPLAQILGKTMIQWVYEGVKRADFISEVIVATEDERIYKAVESFGAKAWMTSPLHRTGTDRIAEVAKELNSSIIVNVQGDEPLINAEDIKKAIQPLWDDPQLKVSSLKCPIKDPQELWNPNVVKVVTNKEDYALYFSRSPIPHIRDESPASEESMKCEVRSKNRQSSIVNRQSSIVNRKFSELPYFKHIGIYVYRRDFLLEFAQMPQTSLEKIENLEQLRVLELGFKIKVPTTSSEYIGVDTKEDLEKVIKRIRPERT